MTEHSLIASLQKFENVGNSEVNSLSAFLKTKYDFDTTIYTPIYFNRRLVYSMQKLKVATIQEYIERLNKVDFFEQFLYDITNDGVEFFRDSQVWISLATSFSDYFDKNSSAKIWLPDCAAGEDLYSLLIILDQLGFNQRCMIVASSNSQNRIDAIKKGLYNKSFEETKLNFEKVGIKNYHKYIRQIDTAIQLPVHLLDNVTFINAPIHKSEYSIYFDFVLFRNMLLQICKVGQIDIEKILYNSLKLGGNLCIGTGERLINTPMNELYFTINEESKLYQKK